MTIEFSEFPDHSGLYDFFNVQVRNGDKYIVKTRDGTVQEAIAEVDEYAYLVDVVGEYIDDVERVKPLGEDDHIHFVISATKADVHRLQAALVDLSSDPEKP